MRKVGSVLAAVVLAAVIASPTWAYPTFAGPTGMAVFPTTDTADRGITLAADWQQIVPSETVFFFLPSDKVDVLHGRFLWGLGKAELGASFTSMENTVVDGDGFGVNGKIRLLDEGPDSPVGFAIGFHWNEMDPLLDASGSYTTEDWRWLRIYAAISRTLKNSPTVVRGHIGVAYDEFRSRVNDTSTSPSSVLAANTATGFNLFAGLDVQSGRWAGSVEWGSRAFAAGSSGFSLPDNIFVIDDESVWAATVRYAFSDSLQWQGGYTNAYGPFPIGISEARWFTGIALHFGGP